MKYDLVVIGSGPAGQKTAIAASKFGKSLGELNLKNKYNIQVVSIEETVPDRIKMIPRATHIIKDSDILVIVGKNEDLVRLKKIDSEQGNVF